MDQGRMQAETSGREPTLQELIQDFREVADESQRAAFELLLETAVADNMSVQDLYDLMCEMEQQKRG